MSVVESGLEDYGYELFTEKRYTTEPMVAHKDFEQKKETLINDLGRHNCELRFRHSAVGYSETWDDDESKTMEWCRSMEKSGECEIEGDGTECESE